MTTFLHALLLSYRDAVFHGGSLDRKVLSVPEGRRYTHETGERYVRTGVYVFIDEASGEYRFERFEFKLADFLDEWDESEAVVTDVDMTGREATVAKLMAERADLEASAAAGIGEDV